MKDWFSVSLFVSLLKKNISFIEMIGEGHRFTKSSYLIFVSLISVDGMSGCFFAYLVFLLVHFLACL